MPENEIVGTHYNAIDMERRLGAYREANNSEVANPSVSDFFENQGIKVFREQITTDAKDVLDSFKIYIERVSVLLKTDC